MVALTATEASVESRSLDRGSAGQELVERRSVPVDVLEGIAVDLEREREMSERRVDTGTVARRVGGEHQQAMEALVPGHSAKSLVGGCGSPFVVATVEKRLAAAQSAVRDGVLDLGCLAFDRGP